MAKQIAESEEEASGVEEDEELRQEEDLSLDPSRSYQNVKRIGKRERYADYTSNV